MKPFDYIKSINETKQNIIIDEQTERDYVPFVVNRTLSYHMDTIFYADRMNSLHNLPKKLQFDYLLNTITKAKRYSKWIKKEEDPKSLSLVKEYYKYSDEKARQALEILTPEQLAIIEQKLYKGGK